MVIPATEGYNFVTWVQ